MAYTPAVNLTSSATLAHLQAIHYRKKALDRLQTKFVFREAGMKDSMPQGSGRTTQWFRMDNLSASPSVKTEGTVGTGQSITSRTVQATLSQYANFINISDFLIATDIAPTVTYASDLLGLQAGTITDLITRNIIDAEATNTAQTALATYLRVSDLRVSRHSLQAINVKPFDNGEFLVFTHPYASYDLVNDPAALGLADIFKYNTAVGSTPLVKYEDRGLVTHIAGCKVIETTNGKTYTTSGTNYYRTYVFGQNGLGICDLEGKAPSEVSDPSKQRFNVNVIRMGPNPADPEGVIGAAVSYNFATTSVILEGPPGIGGSYRFKTIDTPSTIG